MVFRKKKQTDTHVGLYSRVIIVSSYFALASIAVHLQSEHSKSRIREWHKHPVDWWWSPHILYSRHDTEETDWQGQQPIRTLMKWDHKNWTALKRGSTVIGSDPVFLAWPHLCIAQIWTWMMIAPHVCEGWQELDMTAFNCEDNRSKRKLSPESWQTRSWSAETAGPPQPELLILRRTRGSSRWWWATGTGSPSAEQSSVRAWRQKRELQLRGFLEENVIF